MPVPEGLEPNPPREDKEQASPVVAYVYVEEDPSPVEVRRISRHEAKILGDVGRVTNLIAPFLLKIEAAMRKNKTRPNDQP